MNFPTPPYRSVPDSSYEWKLLPLPVSTLRHLGMFLRVVWKVIALLHCVFQSCVGEIQTCFPFFRVSNILLPELYYFRHTGKRGPRTLTRTRTRTRTRKRTRKRTVRRTRKRTLGRTRKRTQKRTQGRTLRRTFTRTLGRTLVIKILSFVTL